jgi:hypothetical protein
MTGGTAPAQASLGVVGDATINLVNTMLFVSFVGTVCIMTAGVVSFSTPRPLLSSPRVQTSAKHRHNNSHPLVVVKDNKITALNAVIAIISPPPSWTIYTIGHIIGGTTGTPFVLRATKSWYTRIALRIVPANIS